MRRAHLLGVVVVFLICATDSRAQTIAGRAVDATTRAPVAQATISVSTDNRDVAAVLTDSEGYFRVQLREPGSFVLRASRLGYAPAAPVRVGVVQDGLVEVLIQMREEAILLDPVTAERARGRLPREATIEGVYQRRAVTPRVGSSRVFVKGDPELESAGRVGDFLDRWLQIGRIAQGRCVVYFVNGFPQHPMMDPRTFVREMSPSILEALEYYRDHLTAPLDYQGHGCWASAVYSIVAVWYAR